MLCLIGGVAGAALAIAAVRAVPAIESFRIPRVEEVGVDYTVLSRPRPSRSRAASCAGSRRRSRRGAEILPRPCIKATP